MSASSSEDTSDTCRVLRMGTPPRKPLHAHVRQPREALVVVASEAFPRHLHLGDVAGDEVRGLGADEDADGAAGEVRGHGGTVTSRRQKKRQLLLSPTY